MSLLMRVISRGGSALSGRGPGPAAGAGGLGYEFFLSFPLPLPTIIQIIRPRGCHRSSFSPFFFLQQQEGIRPSRESSVCVGGSVPAWRRDVNLLTLFSGRFAGFYMQPVVDPEGQAGVGKLSVCPEERPARRLHCGASEAGRGNAGPRTRNRVARGRQRKRQGRQDYRVPGRVFLYL